MVSINGLKKKLSELISKFEFKEKGGELRLGSLDSGVKGFVVALVNSLIENYSDDEKYFEVIGVLDDFVEEMHFSSSGADWLVWCKITFDKLNEISSGVKEELWKLEEVRDFYQG